MTGECGCGAAKTRYLTRKQAKQEASRFKARTAKLRPYECTAGFWHLTSQPASRTAFYKDKDFRSGKTDLGPANGRPGR